MSVSPRYDEYLDHFGRTVSLSDLLDPSVEAIGMRHDVDHNLDFALDMGQREQARGCRATYFLLPTAAYWQDADFELKCRQLLDYGHEIGLHVDVFTERSRDPGVDVATRLGEHLERLRSTGATVRGVAAHGAPECYEHGYINYWMWADLRGPSPETSEDGLSAEGIDGADERFRVRYPQDHFLRWSDGSSTALWSLSMATYGLEYEAVRLPVDHYWSDSGGEWKRSGDPLTSDLSSGRHQVLVHPLWWRGPERKLFVLSPARSGSKWLVRALGKATSLSARHEWTLNHAEQDGAVREDKRTNDFQDLLDRRTEAVKRLREGLRLQRKAGGDRLEANVYLPFFVDELRQIEPEAQILHLHRDPRDALRSLLERGWYSTPEDRRRPRLEVPDWDSLNQLERCCWYLRWVHERIAPWATARISFERMVQDPEYLVELFGELDIIVHRRLLAEVFEERIDPTTHRSIPELVDWEADQKSRFGSICGSLQRALGYPTDEPVSPSRSIRQEPPAEPETVLRLDALDLTALGRRGIGLYWRDRRLECELRSSEATSHLLLAEGAWGRLARDRGVPVRPDVYFDCTLEGEVFDDRVVRVFALFYREDGALTRRLQLRSWRTGQSVLRFAVSGALDSSHVAIGLHYGAQEAGAIHDLRGFEIVTRRFPQGYRFASTTPPGSP